MKLNHARESQAHRWPSTVSELMRDVVVTVDPDASVRELARSLVRHSVSIAVVGRPGEKPLGTVSVSDLMWLADRLVPAATPWGLSTSNGLAGVTVRNIMCRDVFGVAPDEDLPGLLRFFSRTGLHKALVIEDGRVLGLVSMADVLALIAGSDPSMSSEPSAGAGSRG